MMAGSRAIPRICYASSGWVTTTTAIFDSAARMTAAPIWTEFMKKASALPQYADMKEFAQPTGVVDVQLDKATNRLATPTCPDDYEVAFVAGTEPRETCDQQSGVAGFFSRFFGGGAEAAAASAARRTDKTQTPIRKRRRASSARSRESSRTTNRQRRRPSRPTPRKPHRTDAWFQGASSAALGHGWASPCQ